MRTYSDTTEKTFVTFHTGSHHGRYSTPRTTFIEQDTEINNYLADLFTAYENETEIRARIGERENLLELFEKALDEKDMVKRPATARIERLTGMKFGKLIWVDCNGTPVGLDVENDGTGVIDIDGQFNTTAVQYLEDCSDESLLLIYESPNYVSADVREYCRERLLEAKMISE